MDSYETVLKYFPALADTQIERFRHLRDLYTSWNGRINLISRKDIDSLYVRHVLHSLSIARIFKFLPDTDVLDVGTGGGFPAVPLAIMFPETRFTAIDSTGKKIKALNCITDSLKLTNIILRQERAENLDDTFDFVTGRAVTNLPDFVGWTKKNVKQLSMHSFSNGIICLKGEDVAREVRDTVARHSIPAERIVEYRISDIFDENFFETKKIVYIKTVPEKR
jgi:16S rRNA (guanine527-N7)-methyltransferase